MSGPISENWDELPMWWVNDDHWANLPPYLRPGTLGSLNQRLLRVERVLRSTPDYPGDEE